MLFRSRSKDECTLRVKATVVRVLFYTNNVDQELSHTLKEMQPRLQLTEEQYNHWSAKQRILLVEFASAHKIGVIHVAPNKIVYRSDRIAFEEFDLIAE